MDKKQGDMLKSLGYAIEEIPVKTIPRMDFYNKEGALLPNLPADPYHLVRWQERGFTITPPVKAEEPLMCDVCNAGPFKAKIGLTGHQRSHKNK